MEPDILKIQRPKWVPINLGKFSDGIKSPISDFSHPYEVNADSIEWGNSSVYNA